MKNKKIWFKNYGPIWGMSGIQGFFGEGYPYHKKFKFLGLFFWGMTFVGKTITWLPRKGNMPLEKDGLTPAEKHPKCIFVRPWPWLCGVALNAVGLSNVGANKLLEEYPLRCKGKTTIISFMAVGETLEERLLELQNFVDLLCQVARSGFSEKIALQINFSCPNTGHDIQMSELLDEVQQFLDIASKLTQCYHIPIMVKFNVEMPITVAKEISQHLFCHGICISNTIPFGHLPDKIDWKKYFGTDKKEESPLAEFGGGGLSGKPLLPLVVTWVREARASGINCHINAGGGILSPIDVIKLFRAGADSVALGSIAFLRPWMTLPCIITAHLWNWLIPNHETNKANSLEHLSAI